jgi:hypothetical protein
MFILKSFKSFVFKLLILNGLRADFTEVRILKGIVASGRRQGSSGSGGAEALCKEFVGKDGYTPSRVFFVRVANTGLMLDAASRIATKGDSGTGASVERRVGRQRRITEDE